MRASARVTLFRCKLEEYFFASSVCLTQQALIYILFQNKMFDLMANCDYSICPTTQFGILKYKNVIFLPKPNVWVLFHKIFVSYLIPLTVGRVIWKKLFVCLFASGSKEHRFKRLVIQKHWWLVHNWTWGNRGRRVRIWP